MVIIDTNVNSAGVHYFFDITRSSNCHNGLNKHDISNFGFNQEAPRLVLDIIIIINKSAK